MIAVLLRDKVTRFFDRLLHVLLMRKIEIRHVLFKVTTLTVSNFFFLRSGRRICLTDIYSSPPTGYGYGPCHEHRLIKGAQIPWGGFEAKISLKNQASQEHGEIHQVFTMSQFCSEIRSILDYSMVFLIP